MAQIQTHNNLVLDLRAATSRHEVREYLARRTLVVRGLSSVAERPGRFSRMVYYHAVGAEPPVAPREVWWPFRAVFKFPDGSAPIMTYRCKLCGNNRHLIFDTHCRRCGLRIPQSFDMKGWDDHAVIPFEENFMSDNPMPDPDQLMLDSLETSRTPGLDRFRAAREALAKFAVPKTGRLVVTEKGVRDVDTGNEIKS